MKYSFSCDETLQLTKVQNGTAHFKNVSNCLNTKINFYLQTSADQSSNLYLNVVHFFNTSINQTSMVAQDSLFPALVYQYMLFYWTRENGVRINAIRNGSHCTSNNFPSVKVTKLSFSYSLPSMFRQNKQQNSTY
jgi:hypothetical protein